MNPVTSHDHFPDFPTRQEVPEELPTDGHRGGPAMDENPGHQRHILNPNYSGKGISFPRSKKPRPEFLRVDFPARE